MPDATPDSSHSDDKELDPLFVHALREFKASLLIFVLFGIWVVGVSWWLSRPTEPDSTQITMGIPTWVFWGVAIPWVAANALIFWFCFRFMTDDPLTPVEDEANEPDSTP